MSSKAALRFSIALFGTCTAAVAFSASAAPVAISGTAALAGGIDAQFQFNGSRLSAQSATIDWPSTVLVCNQNSTCDVTLRVPASLNYMGPVPAYSSGSLNGATADLLDGGLTFTGSVFIPTAASGAPVSFTAPVALTGNITGYALNCTFECVQTGPLWSFAVSGTGTLDLSGLGVPPRDVFQIASYTFTGTATPTPEPASWLLLGAGLTAFAWRRRKR